MPAVVLAVLSWLWRAVQHPLVVAAAFVAVGWGLETAAYDLAAPWSLWRGAGFLARTGFTMLAGLAVWSAWIERMNVMVR